MDFWWSWFFILNFLRCFTIFPKCWPIRSTTRIRSTESIGVRCLDSSACMLLNVVFTLIQPHSTSLSPLHHHLPFPLNFWPPFLFLISIFTFVPFSSSFFFSPNLIRPKSLTLTTLKFVSFLNSFLPHLFRLTVCIRHSIMAPRVGSKCKGKEVACNDSPPPRFDRSTYLS